MFEKTLPRILQCAAAALMLATLLVQGAVADERDHGRRERFAVRHEAWHGEIHRFHEHDFTLWRGGRWIQSRHDGRFGWWWVVGGVWYFYPRPVYPYPDPYIPPVIVAAPAPAPAAPSGPAAPQYWYYCANPQGYYPYVAQCSSTWQRVPANPVPSAPVASAPPQAPSAGGNPPPPPAPSPAPAVQQYWYFCQNPRGYYPTIPECAGGWQRVPASTPPGV